MELDTQLTDLVLEINKYLMGVILSQLPLKKEPPGRLSLIFNIFGTTVSAHRGSRGRRVVRRNHPLSHSPVLKLFFQAMYSRHELGLECPFFAPRGTSRGRKQAHRAGVHAVGTWLSLAAPDLLLAASITATKRWQTIPVGLFLIGHSSPHRQPISIFSGSLYCSFKIEW